MLAPTPQYNYELLISAITLIAIFIVFVRTIRNPPPQGFGQKFVVAALIIAGLLVWQWWTQPHITVVSYLTWTSVFLLFGVASSLWLNLPKERIGMPTNAGGPNQASHILLTLSKKNTHKWQLAALGYFVPGLFAAIYIGNLNIDIPRIAVYCVWGMWAIGLLFAIGVTLHVIGRLKLTDKTPSRVTISFVGRFLRSIIGLGDKRLIDLVGGGSVSNITSKTRRINSAQKEALWGMGIWFAWGIICGVLMGFNHQMFFLWGILFFAMYIPAFLIVPARAWGILP